MVEKLLPNVDAVVWVLDPEKYRDRSLHEDFLAPLARHRDQFLFVLNKVDLVRGEEDRSVVISHVRAVLNDVGYADPVLFPVAASPPGGDSIGVDALASHLRDRLDGKRVSVGKLLSDAGQVVQQLGTTSGVWQGYTIDFEARWGKVRDAAAAGLVPGAGAAAVEDALCRVEDFVAAVSVETGGVFGERMREAFSGDRIDVEVAAAADAARGAESRLSQPRRKQVDTSPVRDLAAAQLDERLGEPMRVMLLERALFGGTVTSAGVGLRQVAARYA
jgi:hypothetical protein